MHFHQDAAEARVRENARHAAQRLQLVAFDIHLGKARDLNASLPHERVLLGR